MKLCYKCNESYNRPGRVCGKCIYANKDKAKVKTEKRAWYLKNKDRIIEKQKDYYSDNKQLVLERNSKYRLNNPEYFQEYGKAYRVKNKDKINAYFREKYKADPKYKLGCLIRNRINSILGRQKTITHKAIKLLGCSLEELKSYIESQFEPGMTWENHGEWHIDHITALYHFDLTDENEFKQAVVFTNLQPLWAIDNLKKSTKVLEIKGK